MDKVKEFFDLIKTLDKIDELKKEKAENEKIINDIKEENESFNVIEKELESLNNKLNNFKSIKKYKPIYFAIIFVGMVILITSFLSKFAIYPLIYKIGEIITTLIFFGVPFTLLGKVIFGELSKGIGYNSLEEIQKEIEEKEKQKELIKSKSETNKEILIEKEQRQVEIDKERHDCVSKIYQYVYEVKKSLNSNNIEFSKTMNNQMLENEEMTNEEKEMSYQKRNKH